MPCLLPAQARAYIADLVDCLAHKSALVEELEESLMDLREDRAQAGRQGAQVRQGGREGVGEQSSTGYETGHTAASVCKHPVSW
jgi:hypothetical protein